MSASLNKLFWHDGNLVDASFNIDKKGKSSLRITALFYKNEKAKNREAYEIECIGVLRFCGLLDTTELKNNMFAGNISNGYLKGKVLWVYFTDGVLEIHARSFKFTKC